MQKITEREIRKIVESALRDVFENRAEEYRTKGSLNKKTIEKNNAAMVQPKPVTDEFETNPEWNDSVDDILKKYEKGTEFDDSSVAGGEFKIDKRNPYFIGKDGKQVPADAISNFHNDFAIVKKNGTYNFINGNGVVLCNDWFDGCNDFEDGHAVVRKENKRNYVDSRGDYLLDTWVDRAGDFVGGEAPIMINGELRHVNRNGEIF